MSRPELAEAYFKNDCHQQFHQGKNKKPSLTLKREATFSSCMGRRGELPDDISEKNDAFPEANSKRYTFRWVLDCNGPKDMRYCVKTAKDAYDYYANMFVSKLAKQFSSRKNISKDDE